MHACRRTYGYMFISCVHMYNKYRLIRLCSRTSTGKLITRTGSVPPRLPPCPRWGPPVGQQLERAHRHFGARVGQHRKCQWVPSVHDALALAVRYAPFAELLGSRLRGTPLRTSFKRSSAKEMHHSPVLEPGSLESSSGKRSRVARKASVSSLT